MGDSCTDVVMTRTRTLLRKSLQNFVNDSQSTATISSRFTVLVKSDNDVKMFTCSV